jgi:hypothetical protein
MPKQEAPRKLPQYGLRNTVDLGGAAQKLEQSERNQRSWSAPPEGRTFEDHPKRCVIRITLDTKKIASNLQNRTMMVAMFEIEYCRLNCCLVKFCIILF